MLEVSELSFAYNADRPDAIPVLHQLSFQIRPGELVAIIGHNGSGKSTLAKLLSAILLPTSGTFTVDGLPISDDNLWEIRRRVGMVFQHPDDQLIANTVIDDVAFGPENLGLPPTEISRRIDQMFLSLGLHDLATAQISELSGGEKQRVAIAGVLAMQPSYLILDEPTTMVAPRQARQILDLARQLRDQAGVAVIHITHFMHEVVDFDRLIVLDRGRIIMDGPPREVFARAAELRSAGLDVPQVTELGQRLRERGLPLPPAVLTSSELAQHLAAYTSAAPFPRDLPSAAPPPAAMPLFACRDLRFTYMESTPLAQEGLRGVITNIYAGETVALLGGTQSGKSTLIDFLAGLRRAAHGQLLFNGRDTAAKDFELGQLSETVGVVFQQPETQLLEEIVGLDVSFVPRRKNMAPADSRALVAEALQAVGLDYETFRLRYVHALSGGQKRRVALAGVLAAQPQVLVLDEPVAGLDPRGRAELATLIGQLTKRQGLTVVLVGSAVDELAELADRAIVLHEGRVAIEGPLREVLAHADMLHDLGLDLSVAAELALLLRPHFPQLPADLIHIEELEALLLPHLPLPAREV